MFLLDWFSYVYYFLIPVFSPLLFISFFLTVSAALPPVSSVSPLNAWFQATQRLLPAKRNQPSAFQNTRVDNYLANEVALGRVAGTVPFPPLPTYNLVVLGLREGNQANGTLMLTCFPRKILALLTEFTPRTSHSSTLQLIRFYAWLLGQV